MNKFKKASFDNLSPELQEKLNSFAEGGFLQKDEARQRKNFQDTPLDQDFFASLMKPLDANPVEEVVSQPKEINPIVKEYLQKKIQKQNIKPDIQRQPAVDSPVNSLAHPDAKQPSFMDQFNDEKYNDAKKQYEDKTSGFGAAQFIAGLGDALAGRSPSDSARMFQQFRQEAKDNTVGDFERRKKAAIENYDVNRKLEQNKLTDDQRSRDMDVNSEESRMAQALAKKMNPNGDYSNLTASKFKEMSPVFEKMYSVEQARLARQDSAANRAESKAARDYEKNQKLETTYGMARTEDDAKQLKSAAETKAKFDSQLQELINLRKDKGVEYLDRNAVARAKQLSRDLLLGYKDLAKLGVLSQSDENILNDIIPADPLGQDWAPGQDPTLHKLEKFQGDVTRDFDSRLDQRLRDPNNQKRQKQQQKFPMQVKKGNQVATVSNEQELKEAREEGFQ